MNKIIFILLWLSVLLSMAAAQSALPEAPALLALKARLERDLVNLDPMPKINFDQGTLIVKFKARNFIMHPIDKTGHISVSTLEREGPAEDGFIIRASIEPLATVHQAVTPSGGRDIYWNYYLNVYPLGNTKEQLFFSLQYGGRLKKGIIEQIKKIVEQITRPVSE